MWPSCRKASGTARKSRSIAENLPGGRKAPRLFSFLPTLSGLTAGAQNIRGDIRATDAKEVGVWGNPAEETYCHPDALTLTKRRRDARRIYKKDRGSKRAQKSTRGVVLAARQFEPNFELLGFDPPQVPFLADLFPSGLVSRLLLSHLPGGLPWNAVSTTPARGRCKPCDSSPDSLPVSRGLPPIDRGGPSPARAFPGGCNTLLH